MLASIMANANNTAPQNISLQIRKNLAISLPELQIDQINTSSINGLYEIISGRRVFYVESGGVFAIFGNLIDLSQKKNLTEEKVHTLAFIDWNKLPLQFAIVKVIGNGQRKIAVFTDPDCHFCKRLDADILTQQKNLTIYYFLYPLGIYSSAENDAKRILCAKDPGKTYIDWMVNGKKPPLQNSCKAAANLEQMKKIGQEVRVEATPTIILPNGQIISGLVPADYLDKLISDTTVGTVIPVDESKTQSKESPAVRVHK